MHNVVSVRGKALKSHSENCINILLGVFLLVAAAAVLKKSPLMRQIRLTHKLTQHSSIIESESAVYATVTVQSRCRQKCG